MADARSSPGNRKSSAPEDQELDEQPQEEHDRQAQPVDKEEAPRLPFPVVGIGASAGGLEAFIEFFDAMPADPGIAFVLVQHLSPDRESLVADILSKHTRMPVAEIQDGMVVEPNHVYVIRPGHTLTIKEGALHLGASLREPGNNRPVDDFFRSLAEEQRERSICIIMSGMGSNGTAGAEVVKAVGGVAIAQDPESSKYPSMPGHLMESGNADFVLRPREMAPVLLGYVQHPYVSGDRKKITPEEREGATWARFSMCCGLVHDEISRGTKRRRSSDVFNVAWVSTGSPAWAITPSSSGRTRPKFRRCRTT